MAALVGYLALGTVDPVSGAFTEAAYAGYARQPIAFDPKGTIGGDADARRLVNTNAPSFPAPSGGAAWPTISGIAVFQAKTGGTQVLHCDMKAKTPRPIAYQAQAFVAGTFLFDFSRGDMSENSPLGSIVYAPQGRLYLTDYLPKAVLLMPASAGTSLAGTLPTS